MFCRECGKEIPENGKFCPFCGVPVIEEWAITNETPSAESLHNEADILKDGSSGSTDTFAKGSAQTQLNGYYKEQWLSEVKLREQYDSADQFYDAVTKASPLPLKWFKFYVNILFPLRMFGCVMGMFYIFAGKYVVSILSALLLGLTVFTYLEMRKLTLDGYRLNEISLFLPLAIPLLSLDLMNILLLGIFAAANLIYFSQRRFLFETDKVRNAS